MDPSTRRMLLAAMESLPRGCRFCPTDEEAVEYLREQGCWGGFIVVPHFDIYQCEPVELPMQFQELSIMRSSDLEGWFLCKQVPGRTTKRSTKGGFWKITGQPVDVKDRYSSRLIGRKKFLTFHRKEQSTKETKTNWVMHEFHLLDENVRDFVLCHVMLKDRVLDLMNDVGDGSFPEDLVQATMDSLLVQDSVQTTVESSLTANEEVSVNPWFVELEPALLSVSDCENGISLADLKHHEELWSMSIRGR